jgi:hypothetical protein
MEAGCHKISNDEYQQDPCPEASLSRGSIIDLLDSPATAYANHPKLGKAEEESEDEAEPKFDIGTAAHSLLLEGIDKAIVVYPEEHPGAKGAIPKGWTTNEMKEIREAIRSAGKIPLLPKQYKQVMCMVIAAKAKIARCQDFTIKDLQSDGDSELTYIWQEDNGVWCRIRPDWISKDRKLILDYKSTGVTANPSYISAHVSKMGYPIQSSFYRRGVNAVEGVRPAFVFLFQMDEPPYLCSWIGIDPQGEDIANQKVETAIKLWRKFLDTNQWDEYPDKVCYASTAPWSVAEWEEKKTLINEATKGEI